jgi:hypothetical protein
MSAVMSDISDTGRCRGGARSQGLPSLFYTLSFGWLGTSNGTITARRSAGGLLRSDRAKRDGPMRAPHEAGTPLFYLKAMSATKTNRPSKEAARKERMATPNGLCMNQLSSP